MINCKGNVIGILKVLSSSANEDDDAGPGGRPVMII